MRGSLVDVTWLTREAAPEPREPVDEALLESAIGGSVVLDPAGQIVGQVLLRRDSVRLVVRVDIPAAPGVP